MYEAQVVIQHNQPGNGQNSINILDGNTSAITEQIKSNSFLTGALAESNDLVRYYTTSDYKTRETSYSFPYKIEYKIIGKSFKEQQYSIVSNSENQYTLTSVIHGVERSKTGTFGDELVDNNLAIVVTKKDRIPYQSTPITGTINHSFKISSPENQAQQLLTNGDGLSVDDNNGVITIKTQGESPEIAKHFASQIAQHYTSGSTSAIEGSTDPIKQLDLKIEKLSEELAYAEAQIALYKKENQITDLDIETEKSLSVLKELQLQKTQLEMNMAALDNISNYLRKNRDTNNSQIEYGAISDPVFMEQIAKLNEIYQTNPAGSITTESNTDVENLKAVISERLLNTRKRNAVQLEEINRAIAQTRSQLAIIPEQANSLLALDRKLSMDKKVYDLLVEKRAAMIVSGNTSSEGAKIIREATASTIPVSPISWLTISMGLILGIFSATCIAAIKDRFERLKIRRRDELNHTVNIPFIGNIANEFKSPARWEESISDLCTRVLLKPDTKMMTITSSTSGEGKTHIAASFSKSFAAMDKKVLLIDMNGYHPDIANKFEITPEKSLSDVLTGSCDIHDAISLTSYPNLDVLVSGNLNGGVNGLLSSTKRNSIITDLRKHYDLIVIDTPGTANHIDAIPMMKISDLNVFVVRANTTRKQSVIAAGEMKTDYEIDNMHFLLNAVSSTRNVKAAPKQKGGYRKMTTNSEAKVDKEIVPSFLRKIALWFY
jgi:capsular exopolysaccharide synthesis family protein